MIRKLPIHHLLTMALATSALALAGCSSGSDGSDNGQAAASSSAAASATSAPASTAAGLGDEHIKLVYVEWASCTAATNVVKTVLEQQGYTVEAVSVSGAALYSALANNAADATVCAWLPTTHANYYERTKDQLENLGANMTGTRLGLVVPDYVTIDSIAELADHADQFKNRIVGIDPGAGEMGLTEDVIKQYGLPLELVAGSGATMTAALKSAIDNRQWIVVTGWTPHWKWARWDLKYLADPKGVYGQAEEIDTLVGKDLKTRSPQAYAVLDAFNWSADQMQQVMADGRKPGQDPVSSAQQWVDGHADIVSTWSATAD